MILRPALVALACCCVLACDNEVDLLSEDGGVPVVYGVIDGSRDEQLLSVTRTFRFDDGGSALASAREVDSVYYDPEELVVTAENRRTGQQTELERVDLSDGERERPEGIFAPAPNFAYRWRLSAIDGAPGDSIVVAGRLGGEALFSAGGQLLQPLEVRNNDRFPTAYNLIAERGTTAFRWRRGDAGAPIETFEIGLELDVTEFVDGREVASRSLYFPLESGFGLAPDANFRNVDNERFNSILGGLRVRLEADPEVTRRLDGVRAVVTGADGAFVELRALIQANSGITATQELPPFSNVEGGIGLVTTVTQLVQSTDARLTPASLDSLRGGRLTRELNFCTPGRPGCPE